MKRAKGEEVEVIDEKIGGLVKKSEQTGVPYGILKKSYDRGMATGKVDIDQAQLNNNGHLQEMNSMLTGGKADPDLQKQIKAGGYKKKKKASKDQLMNGTLITKLKSYIKVDMVQSGKKN